LILSLKVDIQFTHCLIGSHRDLIASYRDWQENMTAESGSRRRWLILAVIAPRLDLPGTVAVCAALFCLVYGFSNATTRSWGTPSTWGFLAAAAALLAAFIARQATAASPLLPLRIVASRNRGGCYLAVFLLMTGASGVFLFLTYYLQDVRGYSPVAAGLAYLPMLVTALTCGMASSVAVLPRAGPKPLITAGMLLAAVGMARLTGLGAHSGYPAALLGPLLLIGAGMDLAMSPASNTATFQVPPADAGVASAMVNTQQQIGQSVGTALLNSLAVSATAGYLASHLTGARPGPGLTTLAVLHGYTTAFWWAAGILAAGPSSAASCCAAACWPGKATPARPARPHSRRNWHERITTTDTERAVVTAT
jgi:hypothetical protein